MQRLDKLHAILVAKIPERETSEYPPLIRNGALGSTRNGNNVKSEPGFDTQSTHYLLGSAFMLRPSFTQGTRSRIEEFGSPRLSLLATLLLACTQGRN